MNKNKAKAYFITGGVLLFLGLSDLKHFSMFYDGIAVGAGITSLILGFIENKKGR